MPSQRTPEHEPKDHLVPEAKPLNTATQEAHRLQNSARYFATPILASIDSLSLSEPELIARLQLMTAFQYMHELDFGHYSKQE